jgi:hypothetical protein
MNEINGWLDEILIVGKVSNTGADWRSQIATSNRETME